MKIKDLPKGEQLILKSLRRLKLRYSHQHRFKNCKHNRQLPFDFYLSKFKTAIEFDGRQHFESIEAWGGDARLIDQRIKDQIKNNYCRSNNIKLIRIPHWHSKRVHEILDWHLNN